MKVVYIAGRFRAVNKDGTPNMMQVQRNVMAAMERSLTVWKHGGVGLCPHSNTMFFTFADGIDDDAWLLGDIALLERSDAIFTVPGWELSKGASAEVGYALERGLPVFHREDDLVKWLHQP